MRPVRLTEGGSMTHAVIETAPAGPAVTSEERVGAAGEALAAEEEPAGTADEALVAEELLVEEVSIDGMCGVY
jgi:mycofactocin precursor